MQEFKNQGVYCIINILKSRMYVGGSTNIGSRKDKHFSLLRHGKHSNYKLTEDFKKYGEENFHLKILEFVEDSSLLLEKEQFYIDMYSPYYNLILEVDIKKMSLESRKKMSITRKKLMQEGVIKPNCAKEIVQLNLDKTFVRSYPSIMDASRNTGYHRTGIQQCLYGNYKTNKGFLWLYKKQYQDLLKQGELLETPEVDNQQPSLTSNSFEGSTTNIQFQTGNAEESNDNTSALPSLNDTTFKRDLNKS